MNQVYFYNGFCDDHQDKYKDVLIPLWIRSISTITDEATILRTVADCLNPFMNQVYFYASTRNIRRLWKRRLNPFMNQVYFYLAPYNLKITTGRVS
mgnify:CR=1 FL=1